jgi:ubiquinone biosynthesis protein
LKSEVSLIKESKRLNEIITVMAKYGLAEWLNKTNIDWIKKSLKTSKGKDISSYSKEERMRLALTELGTTFIKLGQILSTRSDLVGIELSEELSKLQLATPADGIAKIRSRIKKEFGVKSIDELFVDFKNKPMASASIAQVHQAKLHSGQDVVVKVMHSDIEDDIKEDLKILTKLATLAERHGGIFRFIQPTRLIREFSKTTLDELDFRKELKNIDQFTKNFENDDRVVFPTGFKDFSGKTVLTMSFVEGLSLNKAGELDWSQDYKSNFTEQSAGVFMDMMFRDSFYHADPHPGNLLVRDDGILGVIDCGMVAKLDQKTNHIFEELIIGAAEKDAEHIKNTIFEMTTLPKGVDYEMLTNQIDDFIDKYLDLPLNEFDMSAAIEDITLIIQQHHLIVPPKMTSLLRVVALLEGSSRLLNPEFNIAVLFEKYQIKIFKRRIAPKALFKKMIKNLRQWEHVVELFPTALNKLLRKAGSDNFEVNLDHGNLEKSVNRVVMGLITSALFLGSSMLWSFKVPPVFHGYSVFGIIGVAISSILTFNLIRDIRRSDKK